MKLTRRHTRQSSKNPSIRELWEASKAHNIKVDSRLQDKNIKQASTSLRKSQAMDSLEHFLRLKSQGLSSKVIGETVLQKNILLWKQVLDSLPEHVLNFTRKAMMNQLPMLHNLKLWHLSQTRLCP